MRVHSPPFLPASDVRHGCRVLFSSSRTRAVLWQRAPPSSSSSSSNSGASPSRRQLHRGLGVSGAERAKHRLGDLQSLGGLVGWLPEPAPSRYPGGRFAHLSPCFGTVWSPGSDVEKQVSHHGGNLSGVTEPRRWLIKKNSSLS